MREVTDIDFWPCKDDEIADLKEQLRQRTIQLARAESGWAYDRDRWDYERANVRASSGPVSLLIDRGNYHEAFHILHPIDRQRLRELVLKDRRL